MLRYAHPEVLVDTRWVAEHLTAPKVRVVGGSYVRNDHDSGHISSAVGGVGVLTSNIPSARIYQTRGERRSRWPARALKVIPLSSFMALVVSDTRHSPYGS